MPEFRFLHQLNAEVFDCVYPVGIYKKTGIIRVLTSAVFLAVSWIICGHVCLISVGFCIHFILMRLAHYLLQVLVKKITFY